MLIVLLPLPTYAQELTEVKSLRHWSTGDTIRVVIDLSAPIEFTKGRLSNPERLFFDIKNSRLQKGIQTNYHIADSLIKMIRLGQFNPTTVRVVFDLERSDFDYKAFMLEDPSRLVVDFSTKTGPTYEKPKEPEKDKGNNTRTEARASKKRVVIDPGHGGHDPGAVGPTGLYEKDVVLDVALKAKEHIERRHPYIEVHLTRDRDVFIPLDKRAQVANNLNADLFVSVHANASPNRLARGIETYLLNWTDDEEAMRVAARENAISLKQMKELKSEVGLILTSLERESKRDESIKIAGYVQNALASSITEEYPSVPNLGVKQALFYVLVGAKMPSVLAEVAFISNPQEEKLLANEEFRDRLAFALAEGINGYFMNLPAEKITKYSKPKLPEKRAVAVEPIKYEKKRTQATNNKRVNKRLPQRPSLKRV
jgi:N-acetylmuramoyl-L-alanine amidase